MLSILALACSAVNPLHLTGPRPSFAATHTRERIVVAAAAISRRTAEGINGYFRCMQSPTGGVTRLTCFPIIRVAPDSCWKPFRRQLSAAALHLNTRCHVQVPIRSGLAAVHCHLLRLLTFGLAMPCVPCTRAGASDPEIWACARAQIMARLRDVLFRSRCHRMAEGASSAPSAGALIHCCLP